MSTTNPTDLQLQLALAKELPELIYLELESKVYPPTLDNRQWYFYWKDTPAKQDITPREWGWIVRECERKFSMEQLRDYCHHLGRLGMNGYQCVTAAWQQRAIAYFRTIGKEIV